MEIGKSSTTAAVHGGYNPTGRTEMKKEPRSVTWTSWKAEEDPPEEGGTGPKTDKGVPEEEEETDSED